MGTINSIICAIISALFTVFLAHMSRRKTRVTIYCMENTLLTQRPNVPGLAVFVKYEDMTPIENLWRICYMLKNTGNQNIVGEGIQSSLVTKGHGLPLYTRNIKQIIQTRQEPSCLIYSNLSGMMKYVRCLGLTKLIYLKSAILTAILA